MKHATAKILVLMLLITGTSMPANAQEWNNKTKTVVKHTAIGAGIGAITCGVSERTSVWKGAGIGALTGLGTGVVDSSDTLETRPIVRNTAKGAIVGTGVSAATGNSKVKGAVIGAGAGAGYQILRDYLNNRKY